MSQVASTTSTGENSQEVKAVPFYQGNGKYTIYIVSGPHRHPVPGEVAYDDTINGRAAAQARVNVLNAKFAK